MEKVSLPTKTKIAAICIKILGILTVMVGIVIFLGGSIQVDAQISETLFYFVISFLFGLFIYKLGSLILRKKKWAWFTSVGILIIIYVGSLFAILINGIQDIGFAIKTGYNIFSLEYLTDLFIIILLVTPFLILLILLLLDRKNFWKIAT